MSAPIHIEWRNRPGWGEFLALRGGTPTHGGFDSYTEPKATIYGTADNGTVIDKGHVGGMQWGYYIDVYYPKAGSRPEYVQRDCHLNEMAGIAVGAKATTKTALGRVGRSGNARDIFWPASQSPNGRELWHVHSETYLTNRVDFSKRTNPLSVWGASLAGGGTPILIEDEPERRRIMSTVYYFPKEPSTGTPIWALAGDGHGAAAWIDVKDRVRASDLIEVHGRSVPLASWAEWERTKYGYTGGLPALYDSDYKRGVTAPAASVVIDYAELGKALALAVSANAPVPTAADIARAVNDDAAERLRN